MKYIITAERVTDVDRVYQVERNTELRHGVIALSGDEPDIHSYPSMSRVPTWFVDDDRDKDFMVNFLSKSFAGAEIRVYRLAEAAQRPMGDLKFKRVTEDGILPE